MTNPLTGRILRYRGTFTQEFEDWETVPEEYRPTRLTSLPPR